ncbi:aryl hydrocarbon receptor nuclear translocator-like protein 1 isoform X5 [Coturnix japonica]|uniref:aryl hydrocarbon receptor nuclear translocator-like protein 1 isoform X5 n=1 Tax=Coturnix japonica TaxID=93934 RepID=UPI0007771BB8|nr:aryl hydrocarbon receptor nuclear translocator-like protein 1 isoform X5 [Coturnix japonica]
MADQRMDISSTISDFMSPDPADLISSSLSTSGVDCNRKRKGSSTDYQLDGFPFEEGMDTDKDDQHGRLDYADQQGRIKNAREAHSQIEKRRRDKMNSFIDELASLVPTCNAMSRKLDKLTVLRMAVQHMKTLRAGLPVKTDITPGPSRLCSGARRSFFCRMKCNRPSVKVEDKDFPSTCSKKKADRKSFCTIHSTGYLKSWPPTKMGLDEDNEPDNEGCNLSCLVAIGRLHPHVVPQPVNGEIRVKPTEYVSRHAIDGKFVFVDQRATAILAYLPQELLGTSCYEYFHQDDIGHLAECHRQVLQTREKITTNCYKFKIKDGSFITLRSRWFSFMNPWTKEVEYIVSTNTVVSTNVLDSGDAAFPQLAASPHSMDSVLQAGEGGPKRSHPTVPGIPGGTRAGAGKIGRMIAEEIMEIHRIRGSSPSSCGSSPLNITSTPPPDTSSPGSKKILNGGTPDISSAGLLSGQIQDSSGYPYSDNSSILGENSHIGIDMIDNDQGSSSPSNDEAAMAVIMSLLEADAGLGGPVDFSDLPWPL